MARMCVLVMRRGVDLRGKSGRGRSRFKEEKLGLTQLRVVHSGVAVGEREPVSDGINVLCLF